VRSNGNNFNYFPQKQLTKLAHLLQLKRMPVLFVGFFFWGGKTPASVPSLLAAITMIDGCTENFFCLIHSLASAYRTLYLHEYSTAGALGGNYSRCIHETRDCRLSCARDGALGACSRVTRNKSTTNLSHCTDDTRKEDRNAAAG